MKNLRIKLDQTKLTSGQTNVRNQHDIGKTAPAHNINFTLFASSLVLEM